jgi:group I intron endonuclease
MTSGVYKIENTVNHKVYIGSTRSLTARKNEHWSQLRRQCHPNQHLQNSWNKYGEENFVFSVVENTGVLEMLDAEKKWIDSLKATDRMFGYNNETDPVNKSKSKEHREKISATLKEKYNKGYKHPSLGRVWPEEVKARMAAGQVGKILTEEHRAKISKSLYKQVDQYDREGRLLGSFSSIKEAAKQLGIAAANITMVCNGYRKHTHGFVFKHKVKA